MSQIYMEASFRGAPVEVLTGWDPMQSELFVTVALLDAKGNWREDVSSLLDAWKTVPIRPTDIGQAAMLAEEIQVKLLCMDIAVPVKMLGELAAHIVLDLSNVIVRYDQSGNRTLLAGDFDDIP